MSTPTGVNNLLLFLIVFYYLAIFGRQESKSGCSSYMSFSVKSFFHRHMFLIVIQQVVSVRKCRNECQSAGTGASTVDCLAAKSSASRAECGIPIFHPYCLKVCADDTLAAANRLLQASPSHRWWVSCWTLAWCSVGSLFWIGTTVWFDMPWL